MRPSLETDTTSEEQLVYRNVQRFRGGLVCKARRLVYHSTLGLRVIKKKKKKKTTADAQLLGAEHAARISGEIDTRFENVCLRNISANISENAGCENQEREG